MNSKVYYGNTFLDTKELKENNIKNRIELEYYRTKKRKNCFLREDTESYGIEIVKKEYQGKKVNIEKESSQIIFGNSLCIFTKQICAPATHRHCRIMDDIILFLPRL